MDKIISWNVRGMNAPNKQEDIKVFLQQEQVGLVGFIETKVKESNIQMVMNRVCPNWHWVHNANSSEKGRIILSWKPSKYQFSMILKTDQLVHGEVYHLPTSKRFYLTMVYGRNYEDQRLPMWGDLRDIASSMDDPWCVLGDFNAVMHMGDRIGGLDVTEGETRDFATCVSQCGLQEFPHEGSFFTWTNKTIWSRIDRVFHNAVWYDIIDYTHVQFKSPGLSDHTPIILSFPHCPRPRATFQFCDMWVLDKGFREIVKIPLSRLSSQNSRHQKLKTLQYFLLALQKPLMKLSRQKFADIFKQQAIARNALLTAQSHLQLDPNNQALHDKEAECRDHYLSINRSAVLLIKQQSKAEWIGLGDECTRVFMARIRQRKALTCIYQIRNQDDLRVEGFDAVSKIMTSYYKHLLGGKLRQRSKIDLQVISRGRCLNFEQQIQLCKPFTNEDIKKVMFSIPSHKSPGPDGYNSGFFKSCWEDIGDLVCSAIQEFFSEGHLPTFFGQTKLVLIPKIPNPERAKDFRPISCYNVIYKCITKLLCSRMNEVLPFIIDEGQGAFVKGRESPLQCAVMPRLGQRLPKETYPLMLPNED